MYFIFGGKRGIVQNKHGRTPCLTCSRKHMDTLVNSFLVFLYLQFKLLDRMGIFLRSRGSCKTTRDLSQSSLILHLRNLFTGYVLRDMDNELNPSQGIRKTGCNSV